MMFPFKDVNNFKHESDADSAPRIAKARYLVGALAYTPTMRRGSLCGEGVPAHRPVMPCNLS
ncbi:hypothetical protein BLL52_3695 [Rhodoferax antarcticus ANT.BR]|uniref:Uncharacterized protein n=1 Tax=Rhodoferax antarcticus ANT.BR TaxID=1111071 RepID=A0A1Q8YAA8_9BURK|nr:hypothetical protein BLL52_3695 [Rhodoferax antarcticus ANT.BR]